jgi:hypothetical protein
MIEIFKEKINFLKATLNETQLKRIHIQSVNNFLIYFSNIKSETSQNVIINYFTGYFKEIMEKNYDLTQSESGKIYRKYISQIGTIYNSELNFKVYMEPKSAFFIGVNIDLGLLIFGLLKKVHYIPIATLLLCGYFLYLNFFYKRHNKVYGSGI